MTDQTAARPFGFWMATALVVGSMIGSGIFVLPAQLAPFGASGAAAWLIAVAGALVLGGVLTRLAAAFPDASGVVAISGSVLGPLAGVLLGWSYWVGVWATNAIIAITAVNYLGTFLPALTATPLAGALSATGLLWLLTLNNLGGARAAGRFQLVTTVLKLLPLLAVVLILAGLAAQGGAQFRAHPHAPFAIGQVAPALALVFFALIGFETASVAAERVRDPARNVGRATMTGLVVTSLFYLLICTGVIYAMPQATIAASPAPVALFVETFWGRTAGLTVAAFAVIAAVGSLNGWVLMQGELPLGMARAGLLPRWFARVSRRDVPVRALLVSSVLASILILSNATRGGAGLLDFMLRLTAAATLWIFLGGCIAALVAGIGRLLATIGLAFTLWTLWGAGWDAIAWGLALMLTALPLYWLRPRGDPVAAAPADPLTSPS
ncbi:APC family permease [Sphingomonas dokdonensis]|nr:amino acid permease [Sphingomonas dokdonensis]